MKQLLVLAALVAAAYAWGTWNPGLSVRFDIGLLPGRNFFISIPQTLQAARNSRWVETTRPTGQPRSDLILFTPSREDVVIGAFYDRYGDVAGLQIAIPEDVSSDILFDWETQGFIEWVAPPNSAGVSRTYQTKYLLFVNPEVETTAIRENIYDEGYAWVTGFYGEGLAFPFTATGVANLDHFTRQACIPFMGRHYFFNMTTSTPECTSDQFYPWFALVDENTGVDQLLGVGLLAFGKLPANQLVRDYFERPDESATRTIVPNAPDCFYGNVTAWGGVTMHIYFVDAPLLINCFGT